MPHFDKTIIVIIILQCNNGINVFVIIWATTAAYELSMSELYESNDKPMYDIPKAFEYWGMYRAEMRKGNSLIQHSQLFIANIERKKHLLSDLFLIASGFSYHHI